MRSSTPLGLFVMAVLVSTVGAAEPETGSVRRDPLRVVTGPGGIGVKTYPEQKIAVRLRPVLREPGLEDRTLTVWVQDGIVRGVEAKALADVSVLDEIGLGGEVVATRGLNSTLVITGRHRTIGVNGEDVWFRVRLSKELFGWVRAPLVEVGTRSVTGELLGDVAAPAFGLGTSLRGARFFHPDGHTFRAEVRPLKPEKFARTARDLEGDALIRLGLGMNRLEGDGSDEPWFDALSLAIRFYSPAFAPSSVARAGDQDLLVTAYAERFDQFFWRVPFVGETSDFLKNDYFPAMPFEVEGEEVSIRVRPRDGWYHSSGKNRLDRLHDAIEHGHAVFIVEVREDYIYTGFDMIDRYRRGLPVVRPWFQLAEIEIKEQVDVDQDALHFHPGMAGRGLQPTGWVSQMRGAVYRASQDAREGAAEETPRAGIIGGRWD